MSSDMEAACRIYNTKEIIMNNKMITLTLTWLLILTSTMLLIGCGDDNTPSTDQQLSAQQQLPLHQSSEQEIITSVATTNAQPEEPAFNRQQVLQDYGDTALTILDVSERNKDGRNSIAITLSVPLDPAENHQKYFSISEARKGSVDGALIISKSGKTVWFPYVKPDTNYNVTIYQGLKAANKQRLSHTKNASVKTSELTPSVNFDTTGAFLTQGLSLIHI